MGDGIRFEHIVKTFPGVKALSDVSFTIREGEVHALLGENGAGKSTLLNILHGIYQADEGHLYLKDKEVCFRSPNEAILGGILKVHQEINTVKDLTVAQNITLGYEKTRNRFFVDYGYTNKSVNEVLDRLHCTFRAEDLVSSLSAGEMQMIAIARALYYNATVISFDEPTASLTEKETNALFSIIGELKAQGITILYVSHRLEEIFRICDRATVLRDGKYITTVNVSDITRDELITYMAGHEVKSNIDKNHRSFAADPVLMEVKGFSSGKKFRNVSFDLKKGEILGFFGLVGAGRTEVMRAILGADPKDEGTVVFEGRPVNIRNTQDALKLGMGLLPEERKTQGFVNLMTNMENASLSALDKYTSRGFVNKKKLLENYKEKAKDLRIHPENPEFLTVNLSGGNQQKVILARWLSTDSKLLVFDEPTKGIDVATKVEIYRLMMKAVEQGKSIIMISSELSEVLQVSDRVIVMYEGEITAVLENDGHLMENTVLSYAMGEKQ